MQLAAPKALLFNCKLQLNQLLLHKTLIVYMLPVIYLQQVQANRQCADIDPIAARIY